MPRSLAVETLSIRGFRNLTSVDVALGPRFNVLSGDNGQGKTNFVEALYVVATSRSFRTSRLTEVIAEGTGAASVLAQIRDAHSRREQSVGLKPGGRIVRVDGKRPASLAAYAVQTPAVVFHPAAVALAAGGGSERRKLLDRVALYRWPAYLGELDGYGRALRARQRTLEVRGDSASDLDGWEELVVRHGIVVSEARAQAASTLASAAEQAFERIGTQGLAFTARYEPAAPAGANVFREQLRRCRSQDRARRSASVGPHRDELRLELGGRPVRGVASQGQQRAVVLALQMGELSVVASVRGVMPMLLLDDVSSEMDRARTAALFAALRDETGQVVLTTTRAELIDIGPLAAVEDRRDFRVVHGQIYAGE